jgi:putative membrane protein
MVMGKLIGIVINIFVIYFVAGVINGVDIDSLYTATLVALLLGLINIFIKPLLKIVALPINLLTFGLFSFVIDAAVVFFVAMVIPGFAIVGILPLIAFSLVIGVAGWLTSIF